MGEVTVNEAVDQLTGELIEAWNTGDARAYGAQYSADGTFTNVDGTLDLGRDEFVRHHQQVLRDFAGTKLSLAVRKLRLVRPDVAVVDLDVRISGVPVPPPGDSTGSAALARTALLLVLVKEGDRWWISAHHNVLQSADA